MKRKALALLLALVSFGFGFTPTRIIYRAGYLVYHTPALLLSVFSASPAPAPQSLKAAILNVTTDFNELAHLIQDFLRSSSVDPTIETAFRQFLADRAGRSHPGLESLLDWILAFYKFAFPFLLISLVAKISGHALSEAGGDGGVVNDNDNETITNGGQQQLRLLQLGHNSPSTSSVESISKFDNKKRVLDRVRYQSRLEHGSPLSPLSPQTPGHPVQRDNTVTEREREREHHKLCSS